MEGSTYKKIVNEARQTHELRMPLLKKISDYYKRYVVSFYTSFDSHKGAISDGDTEMLKDILMSPKEATNGLLLLINSPGGDPLAAERFIKVCREFSDYNYWALVPGQSKSAATMISLGASKVIMTATSELGPIDIQVPWGDNLVPAHIIVSSYEELMEKGINLPDELRMEPILQQLQVFNAPQIEYWKMARDLSKDIAKKVLREGMLSEAQGTEFEDLMKKFIHPEKLKNHARPIFYSDFSEFDTSKRFNIDLLPQDDSIYSTIHEYHMRLTFSMGTTNLAKILETPEDMYGIPN